MVQTIQNLLPYAVLVSHVVFVLVLLAFIFRRSWGGEVIRLVRKYGLTLGLLVSLVAVSGSLFYSNVVGFAPCDLCWWQRIFIYPQFVLFLVAYFKKDRDVFRFTLPLSCIAVVISFYHTLVQLTGHSLTPCSATASCTKLYVYAFNYVTIPTMALTIGAYFLLLSVIERVHD